MGLGFTSQSHFTRADSSQSIRCAIDDIHSLVVSASAARSSRGARRTAPAGRRLAVPRGAAAEAAAPE